MGVRAMSMKQISAAAVVLAFGVLPASAQDWAKQSLEKSPRHQEWVEIRHDNRVVRAFLVYPEVKEKTPAIVVIHEIFGLSDWARSAADELAAAGYVAVAPDLLSGFGPKSGGTSDLSGRGDPMKADPDLEPD